MPCQHSTLSREATRLHRRRASDGLAGDLPARRRPRSRHHRQEPGQSRRCSVEETAVLLARRRAGAGRGDLRGRPAAQARRLRQPDRAVRPALHRQRLRQRLRLLRLPALEHARRSAARSTQAEIREQVEALENAGPQAADPRLRRASRTTTPSSSPTACARSTHVRRRATAKSAA